MKQKIISLLLVGSLLCSLTCCRTVEVTEKSSGESKIIIIYLPDIHEDPGSTVSKNTEIIEKLCKGMEIKGVLLEGVEFTSLNDRIKEPDKTKKEKIYEIDGLLLDLKLELLKVYSDEKSFDQVFKAYSKINSWARHRKLSVKKDLLRNLTKEYAEYICVNNHDFQGIKMLVCSPGLSYFYLVEKKISLYGIEDFETYSKCVLSMRNRRYLIKGLDEYLKLDPINKNLKLKNLLENLITYRKKSDALNFTKLNRLREKKVIENISKLDPGNYILIFGAAHKKYLIKEAKSNPRIIFVVYDRYANKLMKKRF